MAVAATAIAVPGSVQSLFDQLVTLEKKVDPALTVYRIKPAAPPEFPALWNWMTPSTFEHRDTLRWRDTVNVTATLAIRRTDVDADFDLLFLLADAFRNTVDGPLAQRPPFTGNQGTSAATWGARRTMAMGATQFASNINALTMDFSLQFFMDRQLPNN